MLEPGTEGPGGFGLAGVEREEHPRWQGQRWAQARSREAGAAQPESGSRVTRKARHTRVSPGLSWAVPHCAGYLMLQNGQICAPPLKVTVLVTVTNSTQALEFNKGTVSGSPIPAQHRADYPAGLRG